MSDAITPDSVLKRLEVAEAELRATRRELDHNHRLMMLGTLTAGVAHELNNILTPTLGYAQLAIANPDDPDLTAKALDRAVTGIQAAGQIIRAALDFSHSDDDGDAADLAKVVETALSFVTTDVGRGTLDLRVEIEPDLSVRMPPLALQQVFVNLLLNAARAIGRRPGRIVIGAETSPCGRVRISVADNGPGIDPALADHLFDAFVSGQSAPSRHGGSGLGLAICRRAIERSGGTISVSETPGGGATFHVELRLASARASKSAA